MTFESIETAIRPRRLMFAIGLFDSAAALQSALRDLANHGFGADRVKVMTSAHAPALAPMLDDVPSRWAGAPGRAAGLHLIETEAGTDPTECIRRILHNALPQAARGAESTSESMAVATGPARAAFGRDDDWPDTTFATSGLERQAGELQRHLVSGGGILIVRLDDIGEQQAVCSMLLHYASRGVQSHQLRLEPRHGAGAAIRYTQTPA